MKESEYTMICNLRDASMAQHALREMHVPRGSEDWADWAAAIEWLYQYCKAIYDRIEHLEDG